MYNGFFITIYTSTYSIFTGVFEHEISKYNVGVGNTGLTGVLFDVYFFIFICLFLSESYFPYSICQKSVNNTQLESL